MIPSGAARLAFATLLVLAALAAACRGEEDEAAIEERLREKGTAEVMAEVAKARYAPPADGRLRDGQVRMYLEVKERGRRIREVIAEEHGDLAVADLRAALELGENPKEFTWAAERIDEAQEAEALSALEARVGQSRGEYLAMLEAERKVAVDGAQKAEIDRQLEEFRNARRIQTAVSPALRHNMELLSGYRAELDEVRLAEAKLAAERRKESGR